MFISQNLNQNDDIIVVARAGTQPCQVANVILERPFVFEIETEQRGLTLCSAMCIASGPPKFVSVNVL